MLSLSVLYSREVKVFLKAVHTVWLASTYQTGHSVIPRWAVSNTLTIFAPTKAHPQAPSGSLCSLRPEAYEHWEQSKVS